MKVERFDIDVRIEGILLEENRAACVVGHVESISKNVMIYTVRRFLQGNDMPFHRNLFFQLRLPFHVGGPGFQL